METRVRNAAPSSGDGQPTSGSTGCGAQRNARATVSAAPIRVCTHDGLPVKSACAAFVRHADVVRRLALRPGPRTTMRTAANSSVGEDPARLSHLPKRTTTTSELDVGWRRGRHLCCSAISHRSSLTHRARARRLRIAHHWRRRKFRRCEALRVALTNITAADTNSNPLTMHSR
ncbi:hypothetical protein BJ912DRAFT_1015171 [Pholiota molesta]|nr:hypothetical protein BJ912DRAFT_1015171 [Pholiota molesta]